MAGNLVISQINGGPIGVINAIINGNFQVNQRGVSGTVTLAAGAYGHDRWKAGASGCTYTFATVNNVTTLTITAGSLIQVIEGINLYSGTYALSWSGTAQGKIGAGSYSGSGVTGSVTCGTNLNIEFNTGTLSLVQFEPGTVATPFERRDYGRELMMCQRYFYKTTGGSNTRHAISGNGSLNQSFPTVSVSSVSHFNIEALNGAGSVVTTSISWNAGDTDSATLSVTSAGSGGAGTNLLGNNSSAVLGYSAEL